MDPGAARDVLMTTKAKYKTKSRVYKGICILARYDEDVQMSTGHEIIYVSEFDSIALQMSCSEVIEMGQLGWFCDELYDCWCFFTN